MTPITGGGNAANYSLNSGRKRRFRRRQPSEATIPAVVVGGAGACGLGVVRSLSQIADIPIIMLDTNAFSPAMHTRFARKLTISATSGPSLVKDLLALRQAINSPAVLFLTSDEAAQTVSEYRAVLESHYRFRLPNHECLLSLMHKMSFHQLAESYGFPVPRSVRIERVDDLRRLARFRFPCIVKPAIKSDDYIKNHFERAYKVRTMEEVNAICRQILAVVPAIVVQEWIQGSDSDIYFCLQYRAGNGSTVCSFTGRKLSIWPPDVGTTASCTAENDARAVLQFLTEAFFGRVSFVGMGSIEFKKDARTGQFLMIEPTVGRVDWQEEVATLNGVNIPLAAYFVETGLEAPRLEETRHPVIWQDSLAHWKSARANHSGQARPNFKVYDAYWRLGDPMPALIHLLGGSMRAIQKTLAARRRSHMVRLTDVSRRR